MKVTNVLSAAIIFLLPGALAPAYAQGHEQEKQPAKQEQEAKPAQSKQQANPAQPKQQAERPQQAKPAEPKQQAERPQQAKPAEPKQQAERPQQAKPAEPKQQAERPQQSGSAQPKQQAERPQQANRSQPAAGHGRIPDDRFRASFGSGHTFHVNRTDFAGGSRRFQYGGFWFAMVNPWPVAWLYTDNVYIDYVNGGYFLCDPVHPGVFLSINIG